MDSCGPRWMGLKFTFPLIWCPYKNYKGTYRMTKKAEKVCWGVLIMSNVFLQAWEVPESSFNLTNFHLKSLESTSDLE